MNVPKLTRSAALALALGLILGSGATACSTTQSSETQIDDAWITTKVKSKLAADPQVSAVNVSVETNEGVVTLTGRVKSDVARREAVKLAKDTEGVRSVRDLLEVGSID
jgi:hyperosmotically inducible protein